jgi:hypothetical protein
MRHALDQVIALLTDAERLYSACGPEARQNLNTAVFEIFHIDSHDEGPIIAAAPLTPSVAAVINIGQRAERNDGNQPSARTPAEGSNVDHLAVAVVSSVRTSRTDLSRHPGLGLPKYVECREPAWSSLTWSWRAVPPLR